MTDTMEHNDPLSRISAWMQKAGLWLGRAGFGLFLLLAAGAALLATTFIGVLLAIAAVFLTLTHGRRVRAQMRKAQVRKAQAAPQEPVTLDARRTADGWVIEPGASWR
jgi:hypothetical protein